MKSNKKGFTLAEVLITLSILGVVAAISVPSLIQNYKKHLVELQFKKAYSILTNVVETAEAENYMSKNQIINDSFNNNGALSVSEYFMNKYMLPYLNINNSCSNCSFLAYGYPPYKNGEFTDNQTFMSMPRVQIELKNGMVIAIGYYEFTKKNIYFVIDLNGKKSPNLIFRDIFFMNISTDKFDGLNFGSYTSGTGNKTLNTTCIADGTKSRADSLGCGGLIYQNGFKIPNSYPLTGF